LTRGLSGGMTFSENDPGPTPELSHAEKVLLDLHRLQREYGTDFTPEGERTRFVFGQARMHAIFALADAVRERNARSAPDVRDVDDDAYEDD
jgi:hypothetical protein